MLQILSYSKFTLKKLPKTKDFAKVAKFRQIWSLNLAY